MRMTADKRAIDKIWRRRDRYEIPDWQRLEVWDDAKKQNLVDTMLRGWKLPKFYFLKVSSDPDQYEVVDGQQRLSAIWEFYEGDLALSPASAKEFGGAYYEKLPQAHQDRFDDYEIEFDIIEDAEESELRLFFQRLQDGLPLTSSEKLNAVHSRLRDFCRALARHSFFVNKVAVSDKRYAHFDIVSKVAVIEIGGLNAGLRYDDMKATFEEQSRFPPQSVVGQRLQATFDYLDQVFPARSPLLKNRTIVQAFATLTAQLVQTGRAAGYQERLRQFFATFMDELSKQVELGQKATDQNYLEFQKSITTNLKTGARTRYEVLLRKLFVFDPTFTELFGPQAVAQSGLAVGIENQGTTVADLIISINVAYAAVNGVDLFKPTNKTTPALRSIGRAVTNYDDYKALMDDLYFIFRESVGQRLEGKIPVSFADVNDLRTDLRHDVDHGSAGDVVRKRMKLGATFTKYAGSGSPDTIAPELWPAIQSRLLTAIESDLRQLQKEIASNQ